MFASRRHAVSANICAEVDMCYRDKRYSDLEIRCGNGNSDDSVVLCHRLIMATVAPKLRDVLRLSDDSELPAVLQIPDLEPAKVSECVDSIYSAIASGESSNTAVVLDREVAEFFGLDENSNTPGFDYSVSEVKVEDPEAINKFEADLEDAKPLKMRKRNRRKRKITDDLDEFVVGEDLEGLEDFDYGDHGGGGGEPRARRKRKEGVAAKGRTKSAENAQPESGSSSAAQKQCVDCGVVLEYATKKEKQRYRDHMVVHERERFTCDCDCEFTDSNAKRRHILLVHSEGKYVKCEQCAFIGTEAAVERHTITNHKSYVCDVCGKTTPTKAALSVHAMDHKMYHCDQCDTDILGRHKFARHMDTTHSGTWPCEKCGAMFKSRAYLQKHTLIMHQKDEDKPHRCADCGKGFVGSNALKTHMMNVHIKARPYACRYGCGAAYNDSSNRGHHERKKHGSNYTPAAATGPPTALPQIQHHHQQQQQR